jgi:hypothetical protein
MPQIAPNFALLDMSHPGVAILVAAMVQAREAVDRRSWSHPQAPTGEEWWAVARDELIAAHGADYAMPNLLNHLAAPGCSRLGSQWDRCGVHYVEPIEGSR